MTRKYPREKPSRLERIATILGWEVEYVIYNSEGAYECAIVRGSESTLEEREGNAELLFSSKTGKVLHKFGGEVPITTSIEDILKIADACGISTSYHGRIEAINAKA